MAISEALRLIYGCTYQFLLLISVPLAFDVGGQDCGVSFTLLLTIWYAVVSTVRILLRRTKIGALGSGFYYLSILILPSLLLLHLSFYPALKSIPLFASLIQPWELALNYATGPFALLEGFCTLVVIQVFSRLARHFLTGRSETFAIIQLVFASMLITMSLFFLGRIYTMPAVIDLVSATLIGVSITACLTLSVYGIRTKKSNVLETSLLFAYIVYTIYLTFTDFQCTDAPLSLFPFGNPNIPREPAASFGSVLTWLEDRKIAGHRHHHHLFDQNLPVLPPIIIDSYISFMTTAAELTPTAVRTLAQFVLVMISAITPSVVVSLVIRLSAFFLALRIIPYIRHPRENRLTWRRNPVLFMVYSYSPCFVIAVYTHLLLQHFGGIVHLPKDVGATKLWSEFSTNNIWLNSRQSWQFWSWANVFTTLALYSLELLYGKNDFM